MAFFEGLLSFSREFLIFYIPIFFTFKYLMAANSELVRRILKFWCILSLYYIIQHILELLIKGYLLVVLDMAILVALNWDNFKYSEVLYDKFVGPLYRENQTVIQKYTEVIEKLFDKNSEALKSKVATSAGEKIKGFMGDVLVGVLNPSNQSKKPMTQSQSSRDFNEEQDEDKQQ